jgi:hypothetical protein
VRISGRKSRGVSAWRHAVKLGFVVGGAPDAAGHRRAAARLLGGAAARGARSGLVPLARPARTTRTVIIDSRAAALAARERKRAICAERIIKAESVSPI